MKFGRLISAFVSKENCFSIINIAVFTSKLFFIMKAFLESYPHAPLLWQESHCYWGRIRGLERRGQDVRHVDVSCRQAMQKSEHWNEPKMSSQLSTGHSIERKTGKFWLTGYFHATATVPGISVNHFWLGTRATIIIKFRSAAASVREWIIQLILKLLLL